MAYNNFGGFGGANIGNLMRQAQKMKEDMARVRKELDESEFTSSVGGGMVAAVGYAMVINMMSTKETWPFFALGFVLAAIGELTLIALGAIGVALALIYLGLKENGGSGSGGTGSGDPLGEILNDY